MKKPVQTLILSGFLLTFMLTKTINGMQVTEEIWESIPGYSGFMASSYGRIKSIDHISDRGKSKYPVKGKIRKQSINKRGYYRIQLLHRGKIFQAHQLIAITFIKNPKSLLEVNHINGIKTDNRVENLEWCTRKQNNDHAHNNGLMHPPNGISHWNAKLDEIQVKTIKLCLRDGMTAYKLAKYFKVSYELVDAIKHGRSWKHIEI